MYFLSREQTAQRFQGKSVAIVGSGPWSVDNPRGFVDSHDVVTRINNFKLIDGTGVRTDCFYSFFGQSIRKSVEELKSGGVTLCIAKCPDAKFMESKWHRQNNQPHGVDFRYIYKSRKDWWFCPTYIPTTERFMEMFNLLGGHVPTTGFAAILEILSYKPKSCFLTGFDFFQSGKHNVNEAWRMKNPDDPIGHVPGKELRWLAQNMAQYPITTDEGLASALKRVMQQEAA